MRYDDAEYEDVELVAVKASDDGYEMVRGDGWSFYLAKQYDDDAPHGVAPKVGDVARFYGRGVGFGVRGFVIGDQVAFYRTADEDRERGMAEVIAREEQQKEAFERTGRAALDADYAALPDVFKRRIDKFRSNNPEFRWKYEGYEMFCCTEAVKLATALKTADDVRAFGDLRYEQQKMAVPSLAHDQHSGNTFGCAVQLAYQYIAHAENVEKMHGALAPLVGSEEYGCVPKDGDA